MVLTEPSTQPPVAPDPKADPTDADPTRWITRGILLSAAGATSVVAWIPGVAAHLFEAGGECPFRSATGLLCPFCGMTHATVALLRGHLGTAIAQHPFAAVYVIGLAAMIRRSFRTPELQMGTAARYLVMATTISFVVYSALRNL